MDYTQILLKPVISEKATDMKEDLGKVAFVVHPDASKVAIQKAVEQAFGVKVASVNVVRKRHRPRKRFGRVTGHLPGCKKTYVTLAPGDKIDFFEGV